MSGFGHGFIGLNPYVSASFAALANFVIDANGHAIAYKFYAASESQITHVDASFYAVGNTSGCTFKARIETDSGNKPSGTVLGAATAGFAGPSSTTSVWWAGGGTNPIALGAPTGALTINAPYWLIFYEDGTSNPDGSNYIQARRSYSYYDRERVLLDDGSLAWTHATAITSICSFIVKHENGKYFGSPCLSTGTVTVTNVYDANKQAVKFRFGSKVYLCGFALIFSNQGTPTNLMLKLYQGSTLLITQELSQADIPNNSGMIFHLSTPQLIPADTDIYLVAVQKGTDETDGGDSSNYYRFGTVTVHETYYENMFPDFPRLVYGTNNDPTALTEATQLSSNLPNVKPLVSDLLTGIDCDAAGGGRPEIRGGNL